MSEQQDKRIEEEIKSKGLTYPRVEKERIDELMAQVTYDCHVVPGTTTTVITAMLPIGHINFSLCTEIMACVDPRNFNAELGKKYGIEKAEISARSKLWELEGYALALVCGGSVKSQGLSFGEAVELAKQGKRIARKGWNGANMFAYIVDGDSYPAKMEAIKGVFEKDNVPYRSYWALKTAQDDVATWTPSGSDTLANDWLIVE